MRKNKLITNTFLLIIGGFITKILGFIIKILYTRYLKEEGVALISLVFPTYSLLLVVSSFQIPVTLNKMIAEKKYSNRESFFNSLYITLFIDLILIILIIFLSDSLCSVLLHNKGAAILIKILCLTLPFVSVTSLIKAYFFGKENVVPVIFSNIFEEIIKLLLIILFLKKIVLKGIIYGTIFYLLINLLSEVMSFIILYIFLPKKINLKLCDFRFNHLISCKIISSSFPLLTGKIISSVGYFFEPIIITNLLLYKGFDLTYINLNYGYYNGYALQILMLPSFFLIALSSALIAPLSKFKIHNNYLAMKRIIKKVLSVIILLGFIFILFIFLFGKSILFILFKTTNGYKYLTMLLPFFALFYLEGVLITILQVFDKQKKILKISFIGTILKYLLLIIFILAGLGFESIIYTEIINIILVVSLCFYYLKKSLSYFY